jgi:hypothetical protein
VQVAKIPEVYLLSPKIMKQYSIDFPDDEVFELLVDKKHFQNKLKLNISILELLNLCLSNIQDDKLLTDLNLDDAIILNSPKISRGENYLGFPWMILDYPRLFSKSSVFAIRTLCWFGNSMSITLHLSGLSLETYKEKVLTNLYKLEANGYWISKGAEEWDHSISNENYLKVDDFLNENNTFLKTNYFDKYLKISKQISFNEWKEIPRIHYETTTNLLSLLK